MIAVGQQKLWLHQIGTDQLERTHRIRTKLDEKNCPHKRAVIVRFRSETVRDEVFRARFHLKEHTRMHTDWQVFLNEDLTAKHAKLAFLTRQMKREKGRGLLEAYGPRPHQNSQRNSERGPH